MLLNNENVDYLSEWPAHYYEIEDINERERILQLAIEQKLDPALDEKRLLILRKRFGDHPAEKRADLFLRAWMMIQAASAGGVSFFQKKERKKNFVDILCSSVSGQMRNKMWKRMLMWKMFVDIYLRKSGKILHIPIWHPVPEAGRTAPHCLVSCRSKMQQLQKRSHRTLIL